MPFVTRHLRPLGLALGISLAALHAAAAQEDKVVATINGHNVTESDLTRAANELDPQFARLPEEQKRTAALSAIIELRLMSDEATAKGLDKDPEFQKRLALLNERALHSEVVDKEITAKINADGTYSAKVPVGEYRVAIETESVKERPKDKKDPPQKADDAPKYVKIPAKFGKPDTSGLVYQVKDGPQEFNVELSD